ncbi:hypothetical protein BV22DRAFT_653199 [Leucogyrophana mollusca]|uniref:Uncharacterized protein n=1 Tax=Leucogyrophana mollusca TaxID=85980 RepID=A0ACB8BA08_9AGAM|nr:hypothetical protein BV22DRAFT_653199 [Leucogyrophana mollusca]
MLSKAAVIGFLASVALEAASCTLPSLNGKDWAFSAWNTPGCKGNPTHTFRGNIDWDTPCAHVPCTPFDKSTHLNDHLASWAFTTSQGPRLYLYSDVNCGGRRQDFGGTTASSNAGPDLQQTSSFKVCGSRNFAESS